MSEQKLSVSRVINAPADAIFDVLTLPQRHREFDGASMIQSDDRSQRIQAVGDVFRMNMHAEGMGDYQMDNRVVAFVPNQVVGWAPAQPDEEPSGHTWVYTLDAQGPDSTEVTLTCDWENLDGVDWAAKMPVIPKESLEQSLNLLAETVA